MKILRTLAPLLCVGFVVSSAFANPLITNVVETGGDNEPTDTITAKWTGVTFETTVANEPLPGTPVGTMFTVGLLDHEAPAFVDRNHRYIDAPVGTAGFVSDNDLLIPSYLRGAEYIMSGNDNRDNADYRLDVTVSEPVIAYMLIDNRLPDGDGATPPAFGAGAMQWIIDDGWSAVSTGNNRLLDTSRPDEIAFDEGADGTVNQYYSIYSKSFGAGTFSLFQADNAGRNMYGAAVTAVPEPSSCVLFALGLLGLVSARRRRS